MCTKKISAERMNTLVVGPSLDALAKQNGFVTLEEKARPVKLVFRKNTIYAKRNIPYEAIIKMTSGDSIAVYFIKTGKKEIITNGKIFSENPLGDFVEIDGVQYQKETLNGNPRYIPTKKQTA